MGACLCIYGRYGTKLALTSALMASAPIASTLLQWQTYPAPCLAGELPVAMEIISSDKNYR